MDDGGGELRIPGLHQPAFRFLERQSLAVRPGRYHCVKRVDDRNDS